MKAKKNI